MHVSSARQSQQPGTAAFRGARESVKSTDIGTVVVSPGFWSANRLSVLIYKGLFLGEVCGHLRARARYCGQLPGDFLSATIVVEESTLVFGAGDRMR